MAKHEKRLAKMRNNPRQVRFSELRTVLEAWGFVGRPGKGDHWSFSHPLLGLPVGIDPRRPFILKAYVDLALHAIEEVQDKLREGGG